VFEHVLSAAAVVLLFLAAPAAAADLAAMSKQDRRTYCVAYSLIDLEWRHDNRMVDEATYSRDRRQLIWKIQNKGDNYNYAADFRRLDRAINEIIAENPPPPELSAQAADCRGYLRL
jgi:hypothetical protein